MVSSVTGTNLSLLQHFLSQLKPALSHIESLQAFKAPPRFNIDGVLEINGTGTVLTGLVTKLVLVTPQTNTRYKSCFSNNKMFFVELSVCLFKTGLLRGIIREEDELYIGPYEDKTYHPVRIASIHCNRLPRRLAKCGQTVSLAFHNLGELILNHIIPFPTLLHI